MSVWLSAYFAEDTEFKTNGREFWRSLQQIFRAEVEEFNRLYSAPGQAILSFAGCSPENPNWFRVSTGNGQPEKFVQLSLEPERLEVGMAGSFIPADTAPYRISLDAGGLCLFEGDRMVSFETITKRALEPLMFPGGTRRVPV